MSAETRNPPLVRMPVCLLLVGLLVGVLLLLPTGLAQEPGAEEAPVAHVVFEDQSSDGEEITITEVELSHGGFIVMHDEKIAEGEVEASIVGVSAYLEPGSHRDVPVALDPPLSDSEPLLAMAHMDTNDSQSFDFVETDGEHDGAYPDGAGQIAMDDATVRVGEETPGPAVVLVLLVSIAVLALLRRR